MGGALSSISPQNARVRPLRAKAADSSVARQTQAEKAVCQVGARTAVVNGSASAASVFRCLPRSNARNDRSPNLPA